MVQASARISDHFLPLTDPRRGKVTYPLLDMVFMSICAVIGGADDFVGIAKWCQKHRDWLARFIDLENGIPSHDRFNAVLAMIKPEEFERCLLSWILSLHEITDGQVIAIDGKTLRRSYDRKSGKQAIHMVTAWATRNLVSLGQLAVGDKQNEITAIPKLLQLLDISGALITIDAMGCQVEIAAKIVDGGGDYCLAVKQNQPTLHAGIQAFFEDHLADDFARQRAWKYETKEKGHGRIDHRQYYVCQLPDHLPDAKRWKGLKAIGLAIGTTNRNGQESIEPRYYILSRRMSARRFANAVRSHWSIENRLHWQLDVTFQEDLCRVRKGHADVNFSSLRRTALSLLKNEKSAGVGVKNKRLMAAWDVEYLTQVLFGTTVKVQ
ncbi:MAG TPA: ISAs1 family transposase [Planctomycetaceae bacterium]|nr:ISAs1 family transposase [Planctomycetaceae bacterium]